MQSHFECARNLLTGIGKSGFLQFHSFILSEFQWVCTVQYLIPAGLGEKIYLISELEHAARPSCKHAPLCLAKTLARTNLGVLGHTIA